MTDSNASNADFLAAFGITLDSAAQEAQSNSGDNDVSPDTQNSDADSPDVTAAQGQDNQEGQNDQNDNQDAQNAGANNQQTPAVKANQAFAQMRTENTQMRRLIGGIAEVLGIDANTPQDQMYSAVQNAVIQAQAKQQNMDPAVYKKIADLEQFKEQSQRQSFTNKALIGFQAVKNQFNLSDADIDAFADQLMSDGVNPFTSDVNLMSEYKLRNFNTLIAAAEKRGAAQEAARQQTVAAHSTSPNKNAGAGTNTEPDKITSQSALNDWFEKQNTK